MKKNKTRELTYFTLFASIIVVLSLTPLGFIHLGFIKGTIVHIPVIVGSIILGWKAGIGLGFIFGLMSLLNNTLTPSVLSFAFSPFIPVIGTTQGSFWALVICFIPRMIVGWFPGFILNHVERTHQPVAIALTAFIASMLNTVLVMGLIAILFKDAYAQARGLEIKAVMSVILSVVAINGVPEALGAALITTPAVTALQKVIKNVSK